LIYFIGSVKRGEMQEQKPREKKNNIKFFPKGQKHKTSINYNKNKLNNTTLQ